ncbi:MAG: dephospho-CoA kinase [Bacteroidales bacterium]
MIKIAITGGIGSGKSVVSAYLHHAGVPVYDCDQQAKRLMEKDAALISGIISLLGTEAYVGEALNRPFVAQQIFADPALLNQMNALVHPAVLNDFQNWALLRHRSVVAMESAILFESGFERAVDFVVHVSADEETRICRAMRRDSIPRQAVESRIRNQMSQSQREALSHFVIDNNDDKALTPQLENLLKKVYLR